MDTKDQSAYNSKLQKEEEIEQSSLSISVPLETANKIYQICWGMGLGALPGLFVCLPN